MAHLMKRAPRGQRGTLSLHGMRARGFTLLEMLAVIVLIGIIGAVVVTQVGKNVDKGKYGAGKAQLTTLSQKIENYALDNGSPPQQLQDLIAKPANARNWQGPYAKERSSRIRGATPSATSTPASTAASTWSSTARTASPAATATTPTRATGSKRCTRDGRAATVDGRRWRDAPSGLPACRPPSDPAASP